MAAKFKYFRIWYQTVNTILVLLFFQYLNFRWILDVHFLATKFKHLWFEIKCSSNFEKRNISFLKFFSDFPNSWFRTVLKYTRLNSTTKENARGQVQKHIAYLSNCPIQGYTRLPSSNCTTLGALAEFLSIIYAYWRVPFYERRKILYLLEITAALLLEAPSDCQKQRQKLLMCHPPCIRSAQGCVIWWKIQSFHSKEVTKGVSSLTSKRIISFPIFYCINEFVCTLIVRVRKNLLQRNKFHPKCLMFEFSRQNFFFLYHFFSSLWI